MIRYFVGGIIVSFLSLAALGRYKEKYDLDYCQPAMRLRWLVFKETLRLNRRKHEHELEKSKQTQGSDFML
jgi:hypothetical protein